VSAGEAVQVATGAPLPPGADAVIPVEATRPEGDRVWVSEAIPPGRHVSRRGEDIASGSLVLPAGRHLRPQDLGVLSAVGVGRVPRTMCRASSPAWANWWHTAWPCGPLAPRAWA